MRKFVQKRYYIGMKFKQIKAVNQNHAEQKIILNF